MPQSAPAIIRDLEEQLYRSQRSLRLYFSLGGGLLMLGVAAGLHALLRPGQYPGGHQLLLLGLFAAGSLLGYGSAGLLLSLSLPRISAHVRAILVDGLLLPQLFDAPPPGQGVRLTALPQDRPQAMRARINWIVNNWSMLITQLGFRPLPPSLARLHMLYLGLIICVPLVAIWLHSWPVLLVLGSVYILGLALDALECDAVRIVLLDVLRGG